MRPLQRNIVFSYLQLFPIRISWEFEQLSFSLVSFKYIRARNIITVFFDLYRKYFHRSSFTSRKLGWYIDLGQYFLEQIEKTVIIILMWSVFILNETKLVSYADSNTTYAVANSINALIKSLKSDSVKLFQRFFDNQVKVITDKCHFVVCCKGMVTMNNEC